MFSYLWFWGVSITFACLLEIVEFQWSEVVEISSHTHFDRNSFPTFIFLNVAITIEFRNSFKSFEFIRNPEHNVGGLLHQFKGENPSRRHPLCNVPGAGEPMPDSLWCVAECPITPVEQTTLHIWLSYGNVVNESFEWEWMNEINE